MPDVCLSIPLIVIVLQKGKRSNMFRPADRGDFFQELSESLDFTKLPVVAVVVVENSVPVKFLPSKENKFVILLLSIFIDYRLTTIDQRLI